MISQTRLDTDGDASALPPDGAIEDLLRNLAHPARPRTRLVHVEQSHQSAQTLRSVTQPLGEVPGPGVRALRIHASHVAGDRNGLAELRLEV